MKNVLVYGIVSDEEAVELHIAMEITGLTEQELRKCPSLSFCKYEDPEDCCDDDCSSEEFYPEEYFQEM